MRTLEERLATIRDAGAKKISADDLAVMHEATRRLVETGAPDAAVGEGDVAPGFELANQEGETVSLAGLLARGPAVITFFRGHW